MIESDENSDNDCGDNEANPLVVPLVEEAPTQEIAKKWFSLDVFNEADEQGNVDESDSEDQMQVDGAVNQRPHLKERKMMAEQLNQKSRCPCLQRTGKRKYKKFLNNLIGLMSRAHWLVSPSPRLVAATWIYTPRRTNPNHHSILVSAAGRSKGLAEGGGHFDPSLFCFGNQRSLSMLCSSPSTCRQPQEEEMWA